MKSLLAAALVVCSIVTAACHDAEQPGLIAALETFQDYSSLVWELKYNGVAEEVEENSTVATMLAPNNAAIHSLTFSELQAIPGNSNMVERSLYYYHRPNGSGDAVGWVTITTGAGGVLVNTSEAATPSRIAGSLIEQPGSLSILQLDGPPLIPDDIAAAIFVDILDILSASGNFTTFVRLIQLYDVICSFQSYARNSLTVWAPTEDAFARGGPHLLESYNDSQKASILRYHSVRYYLNLSSIDSGGAVVPSYGGFCSPSTLSVALVKGTVRVDSGRVSAYVLGTVSLDVVAIYAVDQVLIPLDSCPAVGIAPPIGSSIPLIPPHPVAAPAPSPTGQSLVLHFHPGLLLVLFLGGFLVHL